MRMWMIDPAILCRNHLLGEHGEIHNKQHSIQGRIDGNAVEPLAMETRHDELAREMTLRGYNHKSPYELPDLSYLENAHREYKIDKIASLEMLVERCPECKNRYKELMSNPFTPSP